MCQLSGLANYPRGARVRISLVGLLLAFVVLPLQADDSKAVRGWLDKMALAVDTLTYQGTLVYTRGSRLDTMRIYHRAGDQGALERVVSLNGPKREVLRDQNGVRCIFPDTQSVVIDTRIADGLFPLIPLEQVANPSTAYRFTLGQVGRVAELSAQVINVVPNDGYRYGYRLWLEQKTAMLLKSELLDETGQPLEQLMFAQITLGGNIADSDLQPDVRDSSFVQVEIPQETPGGVVSRMAGHWQVGQVPDGFMMSGHHHGASGEQDQLEHLVYTDGMATVSIYVEPMAGDAAYLNGSSRLGAVNVFGMQADGFVVTAVGEVPAATVKLMARSVVRSGLASR
jgi:sigma-E factor negative regulatory protein RseB